ncbi:MAG: ribonuclease E inhibitor RraB [Candidatus Limnocylindrales bacterium]
MGFLKRVSGDRHAAPAIDPVARAMERLRQAGADPTALHQTRHFVYVPGVKAAQQLARRLKSPDRQVEVDTSARTGYWLVVVRQSMVITPEAMASLRAEFESAAAPLGGAYDRWQVDLQGA